MYERIPTRGTIIVATDSEEEQRLAEAWFARFGAVLRFRSDDQGCHCCMHLWDVEGPEDAIAAIPERITVWSSWTNPGPPEEPRMEREVPDQPRRRRPRPKWKER
jgi:hypothetical protein